MAAKKKATSRKKKKAVTTGRSSTARKSQDVFDLEQLTEIVQLMKDHGLTEVDLEQDQRKIRLSRGAVAGPPVAVPQAAAPASPAAQSPAAPSPAADDANIVTINSPMVGSFYSKPNPDSPNFVSVGDHIGPETIVCIVEAMKVFNEIPAEVSGKVVSVLVENEASVDFGMPLFKVDTSQ